MARRGPWMIEVAERCVQCQGTGRIPDKIIVSKVGSEGTPGGPCTTCLQLGHMEGKWIPLAEFDSLLNAAREGREDLGTDDGEMH